MQPIIISRFIINLRRADVPEDPTENGGVTFSAPNFCRPTADSIVGDMGGPLEHGSTDSGEWPNAESMESHAPIADYQEANRSNIVQRDVAEDVSCGESEV